MSLPRVFISTDLKMDSPEKDDAQSLIHALMYQDKMDIVGISATASKWGIQDGRVSDVRRILDAYEKDQPSLQARSGDFKSADELRSVSWQGATAVAPSSGFSKPTDGSKAIVDQAQKAAAAGEKLNVLTWGGETDIAQALHDAPEIAPHVRLFTINRQDNHAFDYIARNFKGVLDMWVDNRDSYGGIWRTGNSSDLIQGWHDKHALGHGALGDLFAEMSINLHGKNGVKMGDSPTVLRFISGNQDDPTQESWGGEFRRVSEGYYTDLHSGGRRTIEEDREAWLASFRERFEWIKDGGATAPTAPPVVPTAPVAPTPPTGHIMGTDGDDVLNGTSGDDTIFGGAGDDRLGFTRTIDGRNGADVMYGGTGDDTYWVDDIGDRTIERAGEGYDTTHASISWTLADNVEQLYLRTAAHNNGTGNALDNRIFGNSGNNVLSGMDGNDTLVGHEGDDVLIGGKGDDVLTGGTGRDTFRFTAGDGRDTITDFSTSEGELLDIRGYSGYRELRDENGGTRVVLSGSDSIFLEGVASGSLSADNFRFDGVAPPPTAPTPAPEPAPIPVAPAPAPEPAPSNGGENLLVNGSFESTSVGEGTWAHFGSVAGWTAISGARIELWNDFKGVTATDGNNFAELDFQGARDGFYQDVATVANQAYNLTFDLRGRPGAPLSSQQVEVVWNGVVVGVATPESGWGDYSVRVTGTGGQDRLTIREVSSQSSDGLGALLDNFSLVAEGGAQHASAQSMAIMFDEAALGADAFSFTPASEEKGNWDQSADHNAVFDVDVFDLVAVGAVAANQGKGSEADALAQRELDGEEKVSFGLVVGDSGSGSDLLL